MMRNKGRFQFVDELRKISTIEKMGYVQSLYPQTFDEHKQDNAKFIRYKDEVILEEEMRKEQVLFDNNIITSYKKDVEQQINEKFVAKNDQVTNDIGYYQNWSQSLNQEIKVRDYQHRFYFKHAQPPPRVKEEVKQKNKREDQGAGGSKNTENRDNKDTNEEDGNIDIPHRGKYNFQEITKQLFARDYLKDDKEGNYMRDLSLKNEILEYRKLKNLEEIEKIGDFHEEYKKFDYYIQPLEDQYPIEFIDNSVVLGNNNMKIDFFRDIGSPSRNIMDYTIKNINKMRSKEDEGYMDKQSIYDQQKRELLYLYFLNEEQLKINKASVNYLDLANISMGRITPLNAHMCIRSEKVTEAQYQKLLSKMKKYDMRENDRGKLKEDKEMCTDEVQDLRLPQKGVEMQEDKESNINIQKIIEQINKIKREVRVLQDTNSKNIFDRSNFNTEVYKKLHSLLNILYEIVTQKMKVKYPLNQIREHLDDLSGKHQLGFDRIRILWFIANSYDEIFSKKKKQPDLRDLAMIKSKGAPTVTKYKGNKVLQSSNKPTHQFLPRTKTPTRKRTDIPVRDRPTEPKKGSKLVNMK